VDERYRKCRLPNGLRVIGVENPALHSFGCDVRVHAGPRFEPRAHAGLTHFLEHMIMQGSEGFPTSHAVMMAVESVGGSLDASSHPESLEIYVGVHRKHWRRGLEVLTDVLLHPLFEEAEIEQEKRIVAQEIAEFRDEQGRNLSASELAYSLMFKEHVDELGTRGSLSTIRGFDRELVRAHYQRFFLPQNMVVSLGGAFDFEEVCGVLAASLGAMPGGRPLPRILPTEVKRPRPRAVYRMTGKLPVVSVELSCRGYGMAHGRFGAVTALAHILGGGMSSRLFEKVREEQGLVYEIWSFPVGYSDAGSLNVSLSVDRANLVEAVKCTLAVIEELVQEGVTADELERYKENVRCGMDILCDHPDRLADWLSTREVILGPEHVLTPEEFVARQERLSCEDLGEVSRSVFAPDNVNLVVVGPFGEREHRRLAELLCAEEVAASASGAA